MFILVSSCAVRHEEVFADNDTLSVQNPTKLFSMGIGTSTASDAGPLVGVYTDEQSLPRYDKFYFPSSFVVDKDSDMVALLDSVRNRIAIFTLAGQYQSEIKLPFNLPPVDFAWFSKTKTMVFIFQDSPDIGVLNIDPTNDFSIKSSSAFVIPQASSALKMNGGFMSIEPIDTSDDANDYFVLNSLDQRSSLVFDQASSSVHEASNVDKRLNGTIGLPDKRAVVGYSASSFNLLVQDLNTNQVSQINVSTSTDGIKDTIGTNKLAILQLAGSDENGNFYVKATYPSDIIEGSSTSIVYKVDQTGAVKGKVTVFPSPQMLTNRYIFIDRYGSIFYMREDDKNTISLYEFNADSAVTQIGASQNNPSVTSSVTDNPSSVANKDILSLCRYAQRNNFPVLMLLVCIVLAMIGICIFVILRLRRDDVIVRDLCKGALAVICAMLLAADLFSLYVYLVPCSRATDGTLLTFENLPTPDQDQVGPYGDTLNAYGGLVWNSFGVHHDTAQLPASGYKIGTISPPNTIFNMYGDSADMEAANKGTTFDLLSAYVASAWSDDLILEAKGYSANKVLYDKTWTLSATQSQIIDFNYIGVDKVVFTTKGGTKHLGYDALDQSYENFVMDNVALNVHLWR